MKERKIRTLNKRLTKTIKLAIKEQEMKTKGLKCQVNTEEMRGEKKGKTVRNRLLDRWQQSKYYAVKMRKKKLRWKRMNK